MAPIRVLLVEDHPILASAIVEILEAEPEVNVVAVSRTGEDAALLASKEMASVVLIAYRLPDRTGVAVAGMIRSASPGTAIVFHTADDTETAILAAIDAGSTAYLIRSATADQYVEAVKRAARGEVLIPVNLFASAIARQRRLAAAEGQRANHLAESRHASSRSCARWRPDPPRYRSPLNWVSHPTPSSGTCVT